MCGIAGAVGLAREVAAPALQAMTHALHHRGPDGTGTAFVEMANAYPTGLVHTRLAIIDTSLAGAQPRRDARTGVHVTFNGEIYNFAELRSELERRGHAFESRTDTEVLLRAYLEWGRDSVSRLRGMFAFAIADPRSRETWIVRDRLGIKPVYLATCSRGGVLFASEVRALLACGPSLVPPRLNSAAVESFFAQGMVGGGSGAIVEGVSLLAPGTWVRLNAEGVELQRHAYWCLPHRLEVESRPRSVRALSETLREAVSAHLVADVPVGLFLSGGVDSASLATVATGSTAHVETLSVGFDVAAFDETRDADRIAQQLGTSQRTIRLRGDQMVREIDEVFRAMDQPTVDGFNTYFVARAARQAGLTVALSGVGGDELFGGYASFHDVPLAARWGRRAPASLWFASALRSMAVRAHRRSLAKAAEAVVRPRELDALYLLRREVFFPRERRALQELPDGVDADTGIALATRRELGEASRGRDARNSISALELSWYMREMLLRDGDVFSMAVGLELRVPLLDHVLVERALSLPGVWKAPDPRAKPLLVDAVGARLPKQVALAKKRGFTFPWDAWLRGPLRGRATDAVLDGAVWRAAGVCGDASARFWKRFQDRDPAVPAIAAMTLWVLAEYLRIHPLVLS